MIVVVTGSREWTDKTTLYASLDGLHARHGVTAVVHGAQRGADVVSGLWAQERGVIEVTIPYASAYGKKGGGIRNGWVLDVASALARTSGEPLLVVAFPTPDSVGTWNCVTQAKQRALSIRIVKEAQAHADD